VGFSEFIFGLKGLITAKIVVLGVLRCGDWARWVGKSFEFLVFSF
jgi:hypothetical protein